MGKHLRISTPPLMVRSITLQGAGLEHSSPDGPMLWCREPKGAKVDRRTPSDTENAFEGPEKLLEMWFVPGDGCGLGLRKITRADWEVMLGLVHCKVLSTLSSDSCDAYLLSESSFFVFAHKLILKTCGTTSLLLGIDAILDLAKKA